MSIKVMTNVWAESKQKGSKLLLLLALADHADDNGFCFPGTETLAQKIRMTTQSVYNLTKALIEDGELVKISRQDMGRSNTYIVLIGATIDEIKAASKRADSFGGGQIFLPPSTCEILGGDKIAALGGDKIAILRGDKEAILPEPSVNASSEPSVKDHPVSEKRKPDILDAMVRFSSREESASWTVPAAAGGADDWQDAVTAFAELTGIDPGLLTAKERREWSRVLERVGAARKVGPAVVVEVIRKVPDSEDNWRTFSKPHELEAVLKKLIGQHLNGGIRGPKGHNGVKPISQQIAEYRAKVAKRNQGAEIIDGAWEVL